MTKPDWRERSGNDRYLGFVVDALEELTHMLHFKYDLYIVPDGNFGAKKPNGEWNGMVGEVLNGVGQSQGQIHVQVQGHVQAQGQSQGQDQSRS